MQCKQLHGFTLIEIMVVIVIIGVMAAMAALSVGVIGRDSEVEDQARRVWSVLQQGREECELQSVNVGMYLARDSYEFLRLDQRHNAWVTIVGDKLYATREMPEDLRFRLWLDAREIVLKPTLPRRGDEEDEKELTEEEQKEADLPAALRTIDRKPRPVQADLPQISVLSSGEIIPFELQIERGTERALWRIVALPDNDLRLEQREDNEDWQLVAQTKQDPEAQTDERK